MSETSWVKVEDKQKIIDDIPSVTSSWVKVLLYSLLEI